MGELAAKLILDRILHPEIRPRSRTVIDTTIMGRDSVRNLLSSSAAARSL